MNYNRLFGTLFRSCLTCILLCFVTFSAVSCEKYKLIETSFSQETTVKTPASPKSTSSTSITTATTTTPVTDSPILDETPPTVTGEDFEITQGESVSYRNQITISDDLDSNPTISIDNSAVDLDTPGIYPVTYTVSDKAGNQTVLVLQLTVKKKIPPEEEAVLAEAQTILSSITDDSMSDLQMAYTIYRWTKYNIGYVDSSDKTSWVIGAQDGFKTRRGDCYTYYAVAKALLTAAGIDNVDMVKYRTSEKQSRHYWLLVNVGDGWYHFDATPYVYKNSNFFMVTDQELSAWDAKYYKGAHNFIDEGLPARATESIQDRVNYSSSKLKN